MESPRQTGQKLEDFLEEILIAIFKFLPADDIENAAKVCKRWHTIITNSSKLTSKPLLVFYFDDPNHLVPENVELMIIETRQRSKEFPFRRINFFAYPTTEIWSNRNFKIIEAFKEILSDHKDHIQQLTIAKYEKKFLIHLLNKTGINENLTKLELLYDDDNGSAPAEDVRFDFPNLKHLTVCMGSKFIDLIRSHKIERLEILGFALDNSRSKSGNWQEFLKTCPNLKRLRTGDFFNFDISIYDFKIESCELFSRAWSMSDKENIKKFLLAQRETLKDLKMNRVSAEVFHVVINDLKVKSFKTDQELINAAGKVLKINSSIKAAKFSMGHNTPECLSFYEKLINCLTEVEDLTINVANENVHNIMNFIATSMMKLRKLDIILDNSELTPENYKASKENELDLKIEQVESLTVRHWPEYFEGRLKVLTSCPNISSLSIANEHIKADELKVICSLNNLELLSIEGEAEFTSEVIELMLTTKIKKITSKGFGYEEVYVPEELKRSRIHFDCIIKPKTSYLMGW